MSSDLPTRPRLQSTNCSLIHGTAHLLLGKLPEQAKGGLSTYSASRPPCRRPRRASPMRSRVGWPVFVGRLQSPTPTARITDADRKRPQCAGSGKPHRYENCRGILVRRISLMLLALRKPLPQYRTADRDACGFQGMSMGRSRHFPATNFGDRRSPAKSANWKPWKNRIAVPKD